MSTIIGLVSTFRLPLQLDHFYYFHVPVVPMILGHMDL